MVYSINLGAVLAPAISLVAVLILYHYVGSEYLGADENEHWNRLRRAVLGGFDGLVREHTDFALTNRARPGERVGSLPLTSQQLAVALEEAGYLQGILSGLKTRPRGAEQGDEVQYESGSMVYRESKSDLIPDIFAVHQVHVFWFENGDGTVDVYAHHEYSAANPVYAWPHYRAVGQDYERGIDAVTADLRSVGVEFGL